jgi:hypothetical protein
MLKESNILHENGLFWVLSEKGKYTVMKNGITHSKSVDDVYYTDSSIAIARCNYLAKKETK